MASTYTVFLGQENQQFVCRGILYSGQHNVLLVPSKTVALHLCIR